MELKIAETMDWTMDWRRRVVEYSVLTFLTEREGVVAMERKSKKSRLYSRNTSDIIYSACRTEQEQNSTQLTGTYSEIFIEKRNLARLAAEWPSRIRNWTCTALHWSQELESSILEYPYLRICDD